MFSYIYDDNGYFLGEYACQKNPLESELKGIDVWLLPANATFDKPLEPKEGFNVKWNGESWEYEEIVIPPKPTPEPPHEPTTEEIRQQREAYRVANCDPLTCRKIRLTALGKWTDKEEQDYINAMNDIEALIDKLYPYTEV